MNLTYNKFITAKVKADIEAELGRVLSLPTDERGPEIEAFRTLLLRYKAGQPHYAAWLQTIIDAINAATPVAASEGPPADLPRLRMGMEEDETFKWWEYLEETYGTDTRAKMRKLVRANVQLRDKDAAAMLGLKDIKNYRDTHKPEAWKRNPD